jgi:hypothetical protein
MSSRDRIFYLLMRSYERDLRETSHYKEGIKDIYETELIPLMESLPHEYKFPIVRWENAECYSKIEEEPLLVESITDDPDNKQSLSGIQTVSVFMDLLNDEFAENLGPWASPFSSCSDSE